MIEKRALIYWLLLAVLTLSGCQAMPKEIDNTPTSTTVPLPSATPSPSAQPTVSTETPIPTLTTETATHTPSPAPSHTPIPTATPTTTPTATLTPTPPVQAFPTRIVPLEGSIDLPPGFGISVFARGLNGPRMMALGPDGQLYVAERGAGRIVRLPDDDGDGIADRAHVVARGLNAPSSIAFYVDGSLYVGETVRVLRLSEPDGNGAFQQREVIVDGLPSRGGHNTRTVLLSRDGSSLFVSVGSSCNVCVERDERRATIVRYTPDGKDEEIFATGLRNAVGIAFRPNTQELWATNNGRDRMGDDLPPETIYVVRQGDDAGWPRCHAGRIEDPDLGGPGSCDGITVPAVEMQAHSAPLGLTFYTGQQFPEEYRGDLYVAFHGSWNRSVPTGYKVVRIPMRDGKPGPVQDFAAGWLRENGQKWGRPVDVLTGADGSLFVSDDGQGHIYRIFYAGE
jgi:glucose/arabinose dehydrogenase